MSPRVVGLVSRVALLLCLVAIATWLTVRTVLGDEDTFEKSSPITEVVKGGPVTVQNVVWKLDSLKAYVRLINEETQEEADVDIPDNAIAVMATFTLTPTERTRIDDGIYCNTNLVDDRGNVWKEESVFGIQYPTFCGDDDLNIKRGVPFKIAKVYVVPKSAVPHLRGVITPPDDETSAEERVLITL